MHLDYLDYLDNNFIITYWVKISIIITNKYKAVLLILCDVMLFFKKKKSYGFLVYLQDPSINKTLMIAKKIANF